LTSRLAELGTDVEWKTRLVALAQDSQRVRVGIVRTERAPRPSLRPEWSDMSAETFDAEFVVGADGVRSSVRKILGIEFVSMGRRQAFSFYDAPDARAGDEAHLVIAEGTVNGVYPLQNMSSRFGFELGVGMVPPLGVERLRQLLEARMPWYASQADGFEWSGSAEFHPALA
jgi:2-polyprenyl-6-methoxyphenol hydroxylase-like FAD-dependent oxidoreductase